MLPVAIDKSSSVQSALVCNSVCRCGNMPLYVKTLWINYCFLVRDVIYTSRTYVMMPVSICLSV